MGRKAYISRPTGLAAQAGLKESRKSPRLRKLCLNLELELIMPRYTLLYTPGVFATLCLSCSC